MAFTAVPMAPVPEELMPVTVPASDAVCACTQIASTSPGFTRVALAVVPPDESAVVNVPTGVRVADAADAVPAIPTESTVVVRRVIAA
jgi:hypothetical protein